jgi:plasmid stabilization system protein ParE
VKYQIVMRERAARDLTEIAAYIEIEGSAIAAERWLATMTAAVDGLSTMPMRCPAALETIPVEGEASSLRQLVVGNYRIVFFVKGEFVHVLHVLHAARRPLDGGDR